MFPDPVVRAGTVAPALLTLLMAPTVPVSAAQAVDVGATTYESGVLQAVLVSLLGAVLAIGAGLVLVRHPAGRVPVVVGGLGFTLVAVNGLLNASVLGVAFRVLLILLAVVAVATTVQAALPPGEFRRRPSV